ncbi:MAG: hypothetical protein E6G34_09955 [Actinobacteria bacterium]|nr:MAG: hypothetical protein E6G34_09955 [Actinomycetota bacterium]
MRTFLWLSGAAMLAGAFMASIALAAVNVKSEPSASFSGASVTVTGGNFSGLGSTPAIANLTVTGEATYTCTNPQGHASPGQNPVPAEEGSSGPFNLGNSDHNGRGTITSITASVKAPPTPSAKEVGCGGTGSTKWSVTLNSLTATAAHLTITEGETLVFCRNYTKGGPANGTEC